MKWCWMKAGARLAVLAMAALGVVAPSSAGDDATDAPSADDLKARLRRAEEHVRRFELRDAADDKAIAMIGRPLLSFGDSARNHNNGTLWAWSQSGRPLVFMELYQYSGNDATWVHAVTLTAPRQVVLIIPESGRWEPPHTPLESAPITDAPPPAEKEPARLRQLKELARRFTVHEFWDPDNSHYDLRLLVRPVHRYADAAAEIQDGAAFIIAYGTNPEAVLLIEALGPSIDAARWRYSLARSSHAELHVEFDGREVWRTDRASEINSGATRPYWVFASPVEP
ncbi:MAG TPA: hypothetical protein VMV69_30670 [Pirellulales bacterium]|nr:hypothetical protein [Pirellulales bacterium]